MHECSVTFIGRLSVRNLGTLFTFMWDLFCFTSQITSLFVENIYFWQLSSSSNYCFTPVSRLILHRHFIMKRKYHENEGSGHQRSQSLFIKILVFRNVCFPTIRQISPIYHDQEKFQNLSQQSFRFVMLGRGREGGRGTEVRSIEDWYLA